MKTKKITNLLNFIIGLFIQTPFIIVLPLLIIISPIIILILIFKKNWYALAGIILFYIFFITIYISYTLFEN